MKGDPEEVNITNDFVPNCRNKSFSINQIITGLRQGFIKSNQLPDEIKIRVEAELLKRHPEIQTN